MAHLLAVAAARAAYKALVDLVAAAGKLRAD